MSKEALAIYTISAQKAMQEGYTHLHRLSVYMADKTRRELNGETVEIDVNKYLRGG